MSKIDSWVTKVPRLKKSKVARFSYKAEAYANDNIEGVDSYDYSRDMNIPLATHTDFDASVLSSGARTSFSSVPKNGLNHFFGRVSYNLNKVIDFLSDFLDDFRVQGVETVSSSVAMTLPAYYSGKKLRLVNTHATNFIQITFYSGQTFKGSSTVIIPANTILELELIGTTWLHVSDFTESPPTPWAQYSGKDIPQLPDNVAGTTYKRDNDWVDTDGWTASGGTVSVGDNKLICFSSTTDFFIQKSGLSFSGASNRFIYLYLSEVPAGISAGQVYYSTSGHGISASYYKNFTITKKGIYILDMGVLDVGGNDWITSTITGLRFDLGSKTGQTFILQSIYIGTGAYDRLVFDNSYHYRHLLNNAVVPTPQGLYFNGETSYLRSKDKITLPDVFTFSATVNCAVKSTTQAFCCIGSYGNPAVPFIWIIRSSNNYNLFIPVSDGTAQILTARFVNYFSGYENSDVDLKVEVDFVNKTIKAYRNGIQFGSVVSSPTMVKPVDDYMFLGRSSNVEYFLGYMRNICIYDTALSDTQRNWLAQGNTLPILYDVTNYETEGYVSIQDADGTNTGAETDVDSNGNRILKLPATIKANLTGNASTATLATQALAIKPLGNSISLAATPTSVTKIIEIATVSWNYSGSINIVCTGVNIDDAVKVDINGGSSLHNGIRVIYGKNNVARGIKKIVVTADTPVWDSIRHIYAEILTYQANPSTTTLGIVETNRGTITPSMTEVSSVEGTELDSLSLDYLRGDISSYQHVFTKNIIGNLTGNADTADKWKTARNITISDADGTNTGAVVVVDGSENETLKLPATIKANVTGNASTASKANVRVSLRHGNTWFPKTWSGLTSFYGILIWTDGENIYYSHSTEQYVLNKSTSTWSTKTWSGLTNFNGDSIWTDGENIYYSEGTTHYVLSKTTSTWTAKTWTGLPAFTGAFIWTDGENIYYSNVTTQYVLNKSTSTWSTKTWSGLTSFTGLDVWTDGENIYYSNVTTQYVLNKITSTWTVKTWTGLTDFYGLRIWTDGENIYYSEGTTHYVLSKTTSTWTAKTWTGLPAFTGVYIWTDGENIYYSNVTTQHVLPATRHNYVDDDKYNSLFGTVTKCNCSTLSARFVFSNE